MSQRRTQQRGQKVSLQNETVSHQLAQAERVLRERFGLTAFRPGQLEVIMALLDSGAALAVFPTGGGKSLCYQLPALLFDGVTIVVSPLIALMKDQIDMLQQRGIAAARLDSSLSADATADVNHQLRNGMLKLLYVAPERFNNERFLEQLRQVPIALFAVDEAHCISEWGHNFRPDYLKLAETARDLGAERVLALTATATPAVVADICASFGIPLANVMSTGFHRPNLVLRTTPTSAQQRDAVLIERFQQQPPGSTIVYVTLQKTAERVAELLAEAALPAKPYHAGMEDAERSAVQEWWQASDRAIVVATIAFGMGIDKSDVRYVYHYNLPKSLENYSQEIGRAGRDGLPSIVELLGGIEDVALLENFVYGDTPTPEALHMLLTEVLEAGPTFDVNLIELANRHDLRPLVLRTTLTYLELLSVLRQGTPFYAGYKAQLLRPLEDIVAEFSGERAQFVADVFAQARLGRAWYTIDPERIAATLDQDRQRIVRALEYLSERGWIVLRAADARQRFFRNTNVSSLDSLVAELTERFARRETQDIQRVQLVTELVTAAECQTNLLLHYFGQERDIPCGHCSFCEQGKPSIFAAAPQPAPIHTALDAGTFAELCRAHPAVLNHPRQQARFLCGLSSPAVTRAKLAKHALFGALEGYRFLDVLRWCEHTSG